MGKTVLMLATLVAIVCGAHAQDSYSKDGSCPEVVLDVRHNSNSSLPFGCLSDSDCGYDLKCCLRSNGVLNCTYPVRNATSTAQTNTTTRIIKPGQCPSHHTGRFTFGCSHGKTCSNDGDCYGKLKCCSQSDDECPSVCKRPESNWASTRRPPVLPSSKPHRVEPGICPSNYEQYDEVWGSYDDFTCSTHCNSTDDCAEGELCCVEEYAMYYDDVIYNRKRRQADSRCPVCKKANRDCVSDNGGRSYLHGEIYTETYDDCKVCQCFNGRSRCNTICINYDHQWQGGRHLRPVWIAAGAAAGGALLISILFTLSVCCCLKCCCKDTNKTIVVHQQPPVGQQPGNAYYMSPPREEKLPLADNGYTTA